MLSPLLLAAVSFFTVIVVGSLLVAINDWLERRDGDPQPSVGVGPRRVAVPLFVPSRRSSRRPALRVNRQEQRTRPDLVVDWF